MFVSVTTDEEDHKKVLDFFGIDNSEVPTYVIAKEHRQRFATVFVSERIDLKPLQKIKKAKNVKTL